MPFLKAPCVAGEMRALIGLLLGSGLRRSEAVNLRLDQLQLRESHWVIVDMVGKGGRLRTVPVPPWCKELIDVWLCGSRVTEWQSVQTSFEEWAAAGCRSYKRRSLVCGETICQASRR